MNTAVLITLIICMTIVAIVWLAGSTGGKDKK